jgi:hypothetical protein
LRIYFLAEAYYKGELTREQSWTGKVAWAGKISPESRKQVLEHLWLPETTGPAEWWMTEFEDHWPYKVAPADVYFSPSELQGDVRRPPIIQYVRGPAMPDAMPFVFAAAIAVSFLASRLRNRGG